MAQPADCPRDPAPAATLPLSIDLGGRPGVPKDAAGEAFLDLPASPPGPDCAGPAPASPDVLHGEPGDALHGPASRNLLVPWNPRVRVEQR
jgi:hypothetical protein